MPAVQDFNYKVALASGLRELQAGRLRQAEQQFGYLCAKFPNAPGGYRGLAKVRMEQADRPGALTTLRDGAAKLAKAGEHGGVVALLSDGGSSNLMARVYVMPVAGSTGNFTFGISVYSCASPACTPVAWTGTLAFNTTYNLVRTEEGWRVLLCTAYAEDKLFQKSTARGDV